MKKYFAYIYGQVRGPLSPEDLKKLPEFNRGTMVYPEDLIDGTTDDWKPAFQIPDFGNIPFSSLKPPPIRPSDLKNIPQSGRLSSPESDRIITTSTIAFDEEKAKLTEKIQRLEKELQRVKSQNLEIENLKIQLRDREEKLHQISQELGKVRNETILVTQSADAVLSAADQKQELTENSDYTMVNIPVKKILIIFIGLSVLGLSVWLFIKKITGNQFLREMIVSNQNEKSGVKSEESVAPSQNGSTKKQPSAKSEKSGEGIKNKSKSPEQMTEQGQSEQEILEQYKQYAAAKKKLDEYVARGVSSTDSDFLYYIEAERDSSLAERKYKDLIFQYKNKYGEIEWEKFVKRTKSSSRK